MNLNFFLIKKLMFTENQYYVNNKFINLLIYKGKKKSIEKIFFFFYSIIVKFFLKKKNEKIWYNFYKVIFTLMPKLSFIIKKKKRKIIIIPILPFYRKAINTALKWIVQSIKIRHESTFKNKFLNELLDIILMKSIAWIKKYKYYNICLSGKENLRFRYKKLKKQRIRRVKFKKIKKLQNFFIFKFKSVMKKKKNYNFFNFNISDKIYYKQISINKWNLLNRLYICNNNNWLQLYYKPYYFKLYDLLLYYFKPLKKISLYKLKIITIPYIFNKLYNMKLKNKYFYTNELNTNECNKQRKVIYIIKKPYFIKNKYFTILYKKKYYLYLKNLKNIKSFFFRYYIKKKYYEKIFFSNTSFFYRKEKTDKSSFTNLLLKRISKYFLNHDREKKENINNFFNEKFFFKKYKDITALTINKNNYSNINNIYILFKLSLISLIQKNFYKQIATNSWNIIDTYNEIFDKLFLILKKKKIINSKYRYISNKKKDIYTNLILQAFFFEYIFTNIYTFITKNYFYSLQAKDQLFILINNYFKYQYNSFNIFKKPNYIKKKLKLKKKKI